MKMKWILPLLALVVPTSGCELFGLGDDDDGGPAITVNVTVFDDVGAPAPGAKVVFHDGDGNVVGEAVTAADGKAGSNSVPAGGMVTIIAVDSFDDVAITTFTGVKNGDQLTFGGGDAFFETEVATPWVNYPLFAGAVDYIFDFGCSLEWPFDVGESFTASIYEDCLGAGQTYDVIATALDGADEPIAFSLNQNIAVTMTTANLGAWSTAFVDYPITLTNFPASAQVFTAVGLDEEGGTYYSETESDIVISGAGSGSVTAKLVGGFGTGMSHTVYATPGPNEFQMLLSRETGLSASAAYDFDTDLLPRITGVTAGGTEFRPLVSWTASSDTSATTDAGFVEKSWEVPVTFKYTSWSVVFAPGTAGPIRFPELPAALLPEGTADEVDAGFYDVSTVTGYDALRNGGALFPTTASWTVRSTGGSAP